MNAAVKIYMGRNIASLNRNLTESEFDFFVQDVIVPRFDGFTISNVVGYWKGNKEETFVLEVIATRGWELEQKINEISAAYVSRYHQDAVLITQTEVEASLYSSDEYLNKA